MFRIISYDYKKKTLSVFLAVTLDINLNKERPNAYRFRLVYDLCEQETFLCVCVCAVRPLPRHKLNLKKNVGVCHTNSHECEVTQYFYPKKLSFVLHLSIEFMLF